MAKRVIVKIRKNSVVLALPAAYALSPFVERVQLILPRVLRVAVKADIDRPGCHAKGDLKWAHVMDAVRNPVTLQQFHDRFDEPTLVAKLDDMDVAFREYG